MTIITGLILFMVFFMVIFHIIGSAFALLFSILGGMDHDIDCSCGCLGFSMVLLVSCYFSYLFTIEALARLAL